MGSEGGSARADRLVEDLRAAEASLIAVLETIPAERWNVQPDPLTWSAGKDAEHVADATVYHQWIVRLTIGANVSSKRPAIERTVLTTPLTREEMIALIRKRTDEGALLIGGLSDAQLALTTKPGRARDQRLGGTIALVLIAHYGTHQADIERKLG
jgi:hypothetical protein